MNAFLHNIFFTMFFTMYFHQYRWKISSRCSSVLLQHHEDILSRYYMLICMFFNHTLVWYPSRKGQGNCHNNAPFLNIFLCEFQPILCTRNRDVILKYVSTLSSDFDDKFYSHVSMTHSQLQVHRQWCYQQGQIFKHTLMC